MQLDNGSLDSMRTGRPDALVRARQLTRRFGSFTAVDAIDLEVRPGEIFGFLGANGAGKTTAIRMLCGLLPPTSGQAEVAGIDMTRNPASARARIGYMSQRFSLYEDLTVDQNIEFYGGVYGVPRATLLERREQLLERLGLHDRRTTATGALPLGWKQRLALGVATLHDPGVLFLDEPTGGVDPISRRTFWNIIYEYAAAGAAVFVTTHYMDEAEYCTRIAIMYQGRIIEEGRPSALRERHGLPNMHEIFLHLVRS